MAAGRSAHPDRLGGRQPDMGADARGTRRPLGRRPPRLADAGPPPRSPTGIVHHATVLQTTGGSYRLAGCEAEPGADIRQEGSPLMPPGRAPRMPNAVDHRASMTRAVGPISMTVCSPASRRVATLHPRSAGLPARNTLQPGGRLERQLPGGIRTR